MACHRGFPHPGTPVELSSKHTPQQPTQAVDLDKLGAHYVTHLISNVTRTGWCEMRAEEKMTVRPETPVIINRKQTME